MSYSEIMFGVEQIKEALDMDKRLSQVEQNEKDLIVVSDNIMMSQNSPRSYYSTQPYLRQWANVSPGHYDTPLTYFLSIDLRMLRNEGKQFITFDFALLMLRFPNFIHP